MLPHSAAVRHSQLAGPVRLGLSLLEVMFSLSLLAVVLSSLITGMAHIGNAQASTDEREAANDILRHLLERIQSAPATELAIPGTWSEASFYATPAGILNAGLPAARLLDADILGFNTALANLEFFIEYYRGLHGGPAGNHYSDYVGIEPGLMQYEDETDAQYQLRSSDATLDAGGPLTPDENELYRLTTNDDIRNLQERPLLVRIIIRWGPDAWQADQRHRLQARSARIADPSSITVR